MKVGAHLCVRNESDLIGRVLRYHLEVQGFDLIIVNDDGSYDGTAELLDTYQRNDKRIIFLKTPQKKGFTQGMFSTVATNLLFQDYKCDFVLPIDADEFWFSEDKQSVREALRPFPLKPSVLVTHAYDFVPTQKDDPNIHDFCSRLKYCKIHNNPKSIFCRAGDSVSLIDIGNHTITYKPENKMLKLDVPISLLCRYHYRYRDRLSFQNKILNQVEGFTLASKGKWLHDPEGIGGHHIWKHYKNIRKYGFEEQYDRLILSEEHLEELVHKNKIFYKGQLSDLVPENPEFLKYSAIG